MKKVFVYVYYRNLGNDLKLLDKVDYINLSFGKIEKENGLFYLDISNVENQIMFLKQKLNNPKIVLSIGGWGCDGFSEAVENDEIRKEFIESIIDKVKQYDLSGIDLDWEYPTVSNNLIKGRPEDKHNYTILLKELKEALRKVNNDLILTAAVPCTTHYYEVSEINKYLDYLHIMSYDLDYGSDVTKHLSPLYQSEHTLSSANEGARRWISEGFDSQKITIGCAFYVRYCDVENDLNHGLGCKNKTFKTTYYKEYKKLNIIEYYDEAACAYYGFNNNTFYSFDHPQAIKEKVRYVKDNNLAGVMCWEYSQDDEEHTLLNAMLTVKEN